MRASTARPFRGIGQKGAWRLAFGWPPVAGKDFGLRPALLGCTLAV